MFVDDSIGGTETESPKKGGSGASAKQAEATTVRKAIFDAWGYLLQSRKSLLIRLYMSWLGDHGDMIMPLTLVEVRRRLEAAKGPLYPSEAVREAHESRMVLAGSLSAGWTVFWPTVGPAAVVAVFFVSLVRSAPAAGSDGRRWMTALPAAAILFPFACFAGLAIQSLFVRPFMSALNRLLFPPDRG